MRKNFLLVLLGIFEIGAGVLFLANGASDIQLGFGLTSLFLGSSTLISVKK